MLRIPDLDNLSSQRCGRPRPLDQKTFLHLGATYGFSEFWSSLPARKFTAVLLMGIFIVSHVFGGLTSRNRNRFLGVELADKLIAIVIMLTLVVLIQLPLGDVHLLQILMGTANSIRECFSCPTRLASTA